MNAPITLIQSNGQLPEKRAKLEEILGSLESVLVAYSGGADSTLLLRVGHDVLGDRAEGAIAVSASIPSEEITAALALADAMGITVHQVATHEFENEAYRVNQPDRCYHCKVALFDELEPLAARQKLRHIVYGANRDDLGDFRPGQRAAKRRGVRAPLLEAGFTKLDIRELSRQLELPTWNKPALACLSSRVPHGTRIEPEVLQRIAAAERFLRELGVAQVRVRTYDTTARVEADAQSIERLARPEVRDQVVYRLKELGYEFITLDLEGFRSGSLNPTRHRHPQQTERGV
jgi:pyridinium-3,5-biscarboxylic acid mononucleotide sulfurtransferase